MQDCRLDEPILLMCSERSGSNLIARMFDAHPQVAAPGTSHLFRVFSDLAWRYEALPDLRRDLIDMFDAKVAYWRIDALAREERDRLVEKCEDAAEMIATLYRSEARGADKECVFIKENSIHHYLPFLESVSEQPRYVFMVRDPRDMALSWQKAPVMRGGVVRAARRWLDDQTGYLKALSWLQRRRPVARLTYEELLARPEETLRRVCTRIGVLFAPEMLRFDSLSDSGRRDADRASAWANLSRPIMTANSNKFAGELTDDQLAYIEALCGPLMKHFGYGMARPVGSLPFGSHDSFEALEQALSAEEPWDKPQYRDLPQEERARFERWSERHAELRRRTF